jgi:hypothetical protein
MMGDSTLVLFFTKTTLGRILGRFIPPELGGWLPSMNINIDI